jgi:Tfp pilus assembly PilM family ATPase
MSLFGSWLASQPPDAAIEVAPDRLSAAVVTYRDRKPVVSAHATEPLPPGIIVPSFAATNIVDRPAAEAAMRRLIDRLPSRPKRVGLVLPDNAGKVSLVRFDQVPQRRDDLDQLVLWQVRKSLPFSADEAAVTYTPGLAVGERGREYLVVAARRGVVSEYEALCAAVDAHAGLVDLASLSLLNMFLASQSAPGGDWLLVHIRADSTSIVIMRGEDVVFYRNRGESEQDSLEDLVHQTTMYYQDRLSGGGFSRVLVSGEGRYPGAMESVRRSVQEHLGLTVVPVEPTAVAALTDRISVSADVMDVLGPLIGISIRGTAEEAAA